MERFKNVSFYYTLLLMFIVSMAAKYLAQIPTLKLFGHLVIALVIGMVLQMFTGLKEQVKGDIPLIRNTDYRLGLIIVGNKRA